MKIRITCRCAHALVLPLLLGAACQNPGARGAKVEQPKGTRAAVPVLAASLAQRIERDRARVAAEPRQYPALVELAHDCFDAARATHDPQWLAEARKAARQSMAIQDTFEAYRALVEIQNYSHQFEDAIRWAWLAADASTNGRAIMDPWIVSALVEAHLGLGQIEQARKLLPPLEHESKYFYLAAAQGQWLNAAGRHVEAAQRFLRAAQLARIEKAPALAVWATVASAGALLDGRDPAGARPLLDQAARDAPASGPLRIRQAGLALAERRPADALALYEQALSQDPDPEVERMAFVAARRAHDEARARAHFDTAERGLLRPIEAGEVYTLGALAQLYADAGVQLDRARALSEQNWALKRDGAARATWSALRGGAVPQPVEDGAAR